MPATYRIDEAAQIVYSRAWGVLTDADLRDNRAALIRDPAFAPTLRQLYDFSGVTSVGVTSAMVRMLAQTSPFPPGARRAFFVPSDATYGLARMYAIVGDRADEAFRIFRDLQQATVWLSEAE